MSADSVREIKALDRRIAGLVGKAQRSAAKLKFRRICSLDDGATIAKQTYAGIYFIEMRVDRERFKSVDAWIDHFRDRWENDRPRRHFTPGIKQGRVARHQTLRKWMPFYLGIRKTAVADRVNEHIGLRARANTGGLKLACRRNIKLSDFRLSTIQLELKEYDAMMPKIERALRNRLNPITGN